MKKAGCMKQPTLREKEFIQFKFKHNLAICQGGRIMNIELLTVIPTGRDNAISRRELAAGLGHEDRTIRRMIAEAREQGHPIISTSHASGYYMAENDEDIEIFERECRAKADKIRTIAYRVGQNWRTRGQISMEASK